MAANTVETVVATPREGKFNKNAARRVRVAGKIPAVVYGAGQDSVAVTVDPKVITRILHSESGHNTIFDLNIEGGNATKAMIVDWQNEPIKGKLLHIDLKRIAMDKVMQVSVPVQLIGIPAGVKTGGGILEHVMPSSRKRLRLRLLLRLLRPSLRLPRRARLRPPRLLLRLPRPRRSNEGAVLTVVGTASCLHGKEALE